MTANRQLQNISDVCNALGADVRFDPEYRRLIVLAWESEGEQRAHFIQQRIQRETADDPDLVCYCFDAFSTLIYTI